MSRARARPLADGKGHGGAPRGLAWAALVALFLLMTLGNVVSATGSGLACPDWPLCHGRLVPPFAPDVLVEYGHRVGAMLTSLLLVGTVVTTIRRSPAPGARRVGSLLLLLLAVQVSLGGITVLLKLPDLVSTAHLVTALLILAGLIVLLETGAAPPRGIDLAGDVGRGGARAARLAAVGLVVLLVQLAVGGYVRHSGAGLACPDFPLCGGDLVPAHWLGTVHSVHRWLGIALLGLFLHLALAARGTHVQGSTRWALGLATLQVVLGIATVLWQLPPSARAGHAALGYALWGVLVWIGTQAHALTAGDGHASASELVEASRAS